MRTSSKHRAKRAVRSRGSSDLTVYMLLTAAGAAMVSLTLPSLWHSSKVAGDTFQKQVVVLENGASPTGGADSVGNSSWADNIPTGDNSNQDNGGTGGANAQNGLDLTKGSTTQLANDPNSPQKLDN